MKKTCALLTAAVMLAMTLAGCGASSTNQAAATVAPEVGTKAPVQTDTQTDIGEVGGTSDSEWSKTITLADGSTYPSGTVTFIAPYAAGGSVDLGIRLFTKYAAQYTDATMIVENITGGSGLVGTQTGLSRPADGNTLWHLAADGQYVTTSNSVCPFDTLKDMSIVGSFVAEDRVWVVRPDDNRFATAEELFQYATEHPGEVSVATSGAGTIASLATSYLQDIIGCEFNTIGYNGSAEAKAAFLGGHSDIMAAGVSEAESMLAENQCKVLFSLTDERIYDDVPTVKELGYEATSLAIIRGLATSAKVDPAVVAYWEDILRMVCENPEFIAEAESMSLGIRYEDSKAFYGILEKYFGIWYEIKESLGI